MIRFTGVLATAVLLGVTVGGVSAAGNSSGSKNSKLLKDHFSAPHRFLSPQKYAALQKQRADAARRSPYGQPVGLGNHAARRRDA